MKLVSVHGNRQRLDGGSMFGHVPRALWSRWAPPDDRGRIQLACRCLLVRLDGRNLLFETGIGAFFPPVLRDRYGVEEHGHRLLENLATLGLAPEDIDIIVLSHLHFDHAGGLLAAHGDGQVRLAFPRARIVVGREAWERARSPHPRDKASFIPELQPLLERSGRLILVDGPQHPLLGPLFRFHVSHGHTPGMLLTEITTDDGPLVFAADLIPGEAWVHLPITMGYDRCAERVVDEKAELLGDLAARGGRLFFTHDPRTAVARVVFDAERDRYVLTDRVEALC